MNRRLSRQSIESICAAAGSDMPSVTRPLTAPIYQNSVFEIDSLEQVDDIYEGREDGFIYSRDANPNVAILERVVADLEDADDSVGFASGLGAIAVTLLSLVESGDTIIAGSELYGGTNAMLRQYMPRLGIATRFVDMADLDQVESAIMDGPKVLLVESITNPLLRLADIEAISKLASGRGTRVIVDNTLATPLLLRPLELGADVTMHSATKSLGGHSDVTGGVAMEIKGANRILGSTLDPFAAWLIVRGIRTLPMRVERSCANAMRVATYLSDHDRVAAVHYPGLPDHPQHELASSILDGGFGHMVSYELDGGGDAASSFVRSLQAIPFSPSLGESRTTISHPAKTSHRSLTPDEQAAAGITDGLIRMSCGIESAEDIIDDLDQALSTL
ncbi:MAG: aminotransferase class I/II-fold pyridoxal phosphate-dependent enzyme [Dehalococcoidia bacterium]|nr:aminotransferase class I/II-fold pyridoxal phosphate-dependent enzyme [Dehalococcoidia bacterium]